MKTALGIWESSEFTYVVASLSRTLAYKFPRNLKIKYTSQ